MCIKYINPTATMVTVNIVQIKRRINKMDLRILAILWLLLISQSACSRYVDENKVLLKNVLTRLKSARYEGSLFLRDNRNGGQQPGKYDK